MRLFVCGVRGSTSAPLLAADVARCRHPSATIDVGREGIVIDL